MDETRQSSQHFLELIKRSHRGKFKIYIGMSAGVGKTYRMLQEAHQLLDAGVDIQIGYIETHGRARPSARRWRNCRLCRMRWARRAAASGWT